MQGKSNIVTIAVLGAALLVGSVFTAQSANAAFGARIWIGTPAPVYHGGHYHGWEGHGGNWGDPGNWRGDDGNTFGDRWDNDAGALVWRGRVDGKVDIYFHGSQWTADVLSGKGLDDPHTHFFQSLPYEHENVQLGRIEGRGRVYIFQQPNRENGFTVGVRISDPQPGRSEYKFALKWN